MSKNNTYSQRLLRQYIDGTISKQDRHELEKLALDDPFLFDSMKGFHFNDNLENKKQINLVASAFETKKKNRTFPLRLIASAASLLLIAAIGFLIKGEINTKKEGLASYSSKENSQIATAASTSDNTDIEEMELALEYESESTSGIALQKVTAKKSKSNSDGFQENSEADYEVKQKTNHINEQMEESADQPTISDIPSTSPAAQMENDLKVDVSANEVENESILTTVEDMDLDDETMPSPMSDMVSKNVKKEQGPVIIDGVKIANKSSDYGGYPSDKNKNSRKSKVAKEASAQLLSGFIYDERGEQLIGAKVSIPRLNVYALSDIDGKFSLKITDKSFDPSSDILKIAYVGFDDHEELIDNKSEFSIVLEEAELLDEIVVSAVRRSNKPSRPTEAYPAIGFNAFEIYLDMNLSSPEDCEKDLIVLRFEITADGDIQNINSDEKDSCFYEAKRVLLNGGKWKSKTPREAVSLEYTFYFRN